MTQTTPDPAVAERLRRRYPGPRVPRRLLALMVAVSAAVGLGWLIWTAYVHATPAVTAQVAAYRVESDQLIKVTLTVDRPDPSVAARCRVIAQAEDFQTVGEQIVQVPPGPYPLSDVRLSLVTLRRATTAVAKGCTSEG